MFTSTLCRICNILTISTILIFLQVGSSALKYILAKEWLDVLSLIITNGPNAKSPIQCYVEDLKRSDKTMFQFILRIKDEKFLPDSCTQNSWFYFLEHHAHSTLTSELRIEIIREFIQSFPLNEQSGIASILSTLKDEIGRSSISLTDNDTKQFLQSYMLFCGRYEICEGPPVHQSTTSVVVYAKDNKDINNIKLVAIKFMEHREQYEREINQRKMLVNSHEYVVNILLNSESDELRREWDNNKLVRDISADQAGVVKNLFDYKYGIVMEPGNRSLQAIFTTERPDSSFVRVIAKNVLECLDYVHSNNIMHGDIKMLNVVRFEDSKFRLIDFDASALLVNRDDSNEGIYAGAKFSSSCLPPEMICKVNSTELKLFNEYWETTSSFNEWLMKIKRKVSARKLYYVIKTFQYDESNQLSTNHGPLPYEPIEASYSIDIWGFGVMLYQLCSGEPLVKINIDDDFVSGNDMEYIYNWNDEKCKEKVSIVKDDKAKNLLFKKNKKKSRR